MNTNFDFLKQDPKFSVFADMAIAAEKSFSVDPSLCILGCRRALEFVVKWMYSVDDSLEMPYQDKLVSLMNTKEFKEIVELDLYKRLDIIRKMGNTAAHSNKQLTIDQAELALRNLFMFCDFISFCYGKFEDYQEKEYNASLLQEERRTLIDQDSKISQMFKMQFASKIDTHKLITKNKAIKKACTARRSERERAYVVKPLELSEYKTRKVYIDTMLQDAGWILGKDWLEEYPLEGMPNATKKGYADYVLLGDDGKPLAVIEAKKTCVDVSVGRQQAKLYADLLEVKFGQRPVIFLTNGFETRIWQMPFYPERKVSGIYAKRDLKKEFNKLAVRRPLNNVSISDDISGRYYQKEAIKAVCHAFDQENRRKALLVMATGSGKTRTVIALVDVLLKQGWVKNILFLADRNSLVTQAKRAFVNLMPSLSITNLVEDKNHANARCVFSTYQTMMNCIDSTCDEKGHKLFTCGHFDLLICDEAHRSIYNKYQDIFTYFDAHLVGLTATPKDEVGHSTYEIFELENGVPTYGYELDQAVKDGYLVDYLSVETRLKFMEEGIVYDDLSDEEKETYENLFVNEDDKLPERIDSAAMNEWILNADTIREMLSVLMRHGIKVDYGSKIGKTIIFAKNHKHAEKIYEVFGKEYPNYPSGYCRVIDNYTNYAQSLIDEFTTPKKLPQIAISVDMLDTGIDIPECVNLVFFKKVLSKSKFWQMIGRGTRLCPGLIEGKDKEKFYIFDLCGNFEFFRMGGKSRETQPVISIQERIFNLTVNMVYELQKLYHQTEFLKKFREKLIKGLASKVSELNRENFAVKQHLMLVDLYRDSKAYSALTYEDTLRLADEIAPLIEPYRDEASVVRFDALIYAIELATITSKSSTKAKKELISKVKSIANIASIPEISAKKDLIENILVHGYIEQASVEEYEYIREALRELMKFIPPGKKRVYETDFDDEVLEIQWRVSDLESEYLVNYKEKAIYYLRKHTEETTINKLKTNVPLTGEDIRQLEDILWNKLGTKEQYKLECGNKPLGVFVREIVGLDMQAAKEAFSEYINNVNLDDRQIYFVNQIVEYIVRNGIMEDLSVLQQTPFTDKGKLGELFESDMGVFMGIRQVIENINNNAMLHS